jgi:uncharacterized protein (DUF1330 family)
MSAYCLFDCEEIYDPALLEKYRQRVFSVVSKFSGKYIVIGGPYEIKEGSPKINFPVLIEFPTLEQANAWYNSAEYAELLEMRKSAGKYEAVFMRGIEEG